MKVLLPPNRHGHMGNMLSRCGLSLRVCARAHAVHNANEDREAREGIHLLAEGGRPVAGAKVDLTAVLDLWA